MLIIALVLAVVGLTALVTAVVTGNAVIAWLCIAASVVGVVLLNRLDNRVPYLIRRSNEILQRRHLRRCCRRVKIGMGFDQSIRRRRRFDLMSQAQY